jgi:hypothetical protein
MEKGLERGGMMEAQGLGPVVAVSAPLGGTGAAALFLSIRTAHHTEAARSLSFLSSAAVAEEWPWTQVVNQKGELAVELCKSWPGRVCAWAPRGG